MKQTVNWHEFWTRDKPGFHEGKVNEYLLNYLYVFNLKPGDSIFMPLCGKAVDILWLSQQGYKVVGVEISEVAVESFFNESDLEFEQSGDENFKIFTAPNITLYQGNFMDMRSEHLDSCSLVYDRASIVAIESDNRLSYIQQMLAIIPQGIPMLVVTLDYDQKIMKGPPFSVPMLEISDLYKSVYQLELLRSDEQIEERPRWKDAGLTSLMESALKLTAVS